MAQRLVVADSASKIEFLKAYYGDNTMGVICRWPLFQTSHHTVEGTTTNEIFNFEALPKAKELSDALSSNLDNEIVLAFDADAKGELVSWQIAGYATQLKASPDMIKRLRPAGFSQPEIDWALQIIDSPETPRGQEKYSRLLFDDYLGRHLIRLLGTDRGPGNLLLRHQSLTILLLLIERKKELANKRHIPKWQIQGQIEGTGQELSIFLTQGTKIPPHGLFTSEDNALSLAAELNQQPLKVVNITKFPLKIPPPTPYRLPELAQEAYVRLGLNLGRVIEIFLKLYRGIEIHGQTVALVTSASSATPPSGATLTALREQVAALYGKSSLGEQAALDTGMIVPLHPNLDGTKLSQALSQDEASLYDLIRGRAFISQMEAAVGESTTIDFLVFRDYKFQTHCHDLTAPGFLQALPPEQMAQWQVLCPAPLFTNGQKFNATLSCLPSTIKDPGLKPYTIESLFEELADFSIVPDPDTLTMVGNLAALNYLTISEQGDIEATDQTLQIGSILNRAFPRMQGLNLAAYIEQTINEAVTGRKNLTFALKQFHQTLMLHGKTLIKAKVSLKARPPRPRASSSTVIKQTPPLPITQDAHATPETLDTSQPQPDRQPPPDVSTISASTVAPPPPEPPPEEHDELREEENFEIDQVEADTEILLSSELTGDDETEPESCPDALAPPENLLKLFADFLSDSSKEADTTTTEQPSVTVDNIEASTGAPTTPLPMENGKICPTCAKSLVIKKDHFGTYWGCTGFPECRYSENAQGLPCPLCSHTLTQKQTSTGKQFFACENSDCQFMSWSTPHYLPCGLCDSPYLIEKTVQGNTQLRCPRAGCSYAQPIPEPSPEIKPSPTSASPKKVMVRRATPGTGTGGGTKKVRVVRRRS